MTSVASPSACDGKCCFRLGPRRLASADHVVGRYGLGTIYYRQEKYELAEYHFTRALSINRQSSVLHCYLGEATRRCLHRHPGYRGRGGWPS
jgi:tetratricopeptide (TPR) repeat protein